jgi:branched-subunit amino acid ABC-type transport system permease component
MSLSHIDWLVNVALSLSLSIAVLVIASIGLAVIFGMMGIINLAHGEFLMLGAYAALTGVRMGLDLWLAMLVAAAAVGLFGFAVERFLIRYLYGRLAESMLATWGLSLIMAQSIVLIFGPSTQGIATPLGSLHIGRYTVSQYSLLLIGAALALLASLFWVFTRSRYGIMARAAMQLPDMAAAVGIRTGLVNACTFALGAALAGASGALLAPLVGVMPSMGQAYIARAFMTVIVGGPGVISGTAGASVLLGGVENIVSYLSTPFLGQGALLVLAIVLLRVLPTGLSGRSARQL